ncbi:unnamed protein product [Phytophthora fragariaefolia]|uniref:Unnamed protein product n=1 Tax=Phytophthora fragariaefolia TaxID=1490495 RepID=A0A9W6XHR3_9STRA|nr:unnamed protein product [Phytophthora fragariaefolia]
MSSSQDKEALLEEVKTTTLDSLGGDTFSVYSADTAKPEHRSPQKKPRQMRMFKPGYSTEYGRRKKAEILALRRQVAGMENWLVHLVRLKPNWQNATRRHHVEACDDQYVSEVQQAASNAAAEFHKRQQSENFNCVLKSILQDQVKLKEAVLTTIRQTGLLNVRASTLRYLTRPFSFALLRIDNSTAIIDQLGDRVSRLYLDCESVFPKQHLPSFGCKMQCIGDKYRGRLMEIVAKAPVCCSIQQASDILWQELSTVRTYPDKVYRYINSVGSNAVAKSFDMTLRSKLGATAVNGLQVMKKFEETDRIVQVRAYELVLPTKGLRLRGHAWTIISKSLNNPSHESEVQFYLQLFMESESGFSAKDEDVKYIQDVGLSSWGLKMRSYSVWLQELVVERAASVSCTDVSK